MRTGRATSCASVVWKSRPSCVQSHTALVGTDGQIEVTDVAEMSVEHHLLDKLKRRLRVAKEIDTTQHRANKVTHEKKWMRATADALDIELDSDYMSECAPIFLSSFPSIDRIKSAMVRTVQKRLATRN
jgi:ATP-dependent RNA helicase DDX24/MAK5